MKDLKSLRLNLKKTFEKNNIDVYDADCIIAEVLNVEINKLMFINSISALHYYKIKRLSKRRLKGCPITKIFKKAYFYGFEFYVNKNVLSCRQETELLVEYIEKNINKNAKILDLCTGSGCIAISLNKIGFNNVFASDISSKALKVAKKNNKQLKTNVKFIKSDLFDNINDKFDVIVSNPPYIDDNEIDKLSVEVKNFDPILALNGGENGLDIYEKIINKLNYYLNKNGTIIFEIGYNQGKDVCEMLKNKGYETFVIKDYSNLDRVVVGKGRIKNVR